jgi:hypothetical protein
MGSLFTFSARDSSAEFNNVEAGHAQLRGSGLPAAQATAGAADQAQVELTEPGAVHHHVFCPVTECEYIISVHTANGLPASGSLSRSLP